LTLLRSLRLDGQRCEDRYAAFSLQGILIVTYIRDVGSRHRLLIFLFPPLRGDVVENASSLWRRHWTSNARHFWFIVVTGSIVLLCSHNFAWAQLAPLTKVDQERLDQTFLRGAIWLRDSQGPEGTWAPQTEGNKVGYAALPALTLLECGLPARHPVITRAALHIQSSIEKLSGTYQISLAILFFDRLLAHSDLSLEDRLTLERQCRALIQVLALRLIAGLKETGGWTYECPVLDAGQHRLLLAALRQKQPNLRSLPSPMRSYPIFRDVGKLMEKETPKKGSRAQSAAPPPPTVTDNSNSHFAIMALWVAQRHDVPIDRAARLIAKRFRSSQNPDGSWGYKYVLGGGEGGSPAMICAGLLGLAIEKGFAEKLAASGILATLPPAAQAASAVASPSAFSLFSAAKTIKQNSATGGKAQNSTDDAMGKAFKALSNHVGQPSGRWSDVPPGNLYFLWAVERVAVLFNLKQIGEKDWYRWGAEILAANQMPSGEWDFKSTGGGYHPVVDTSFALLFLKRANLAEDLTRKLMADVVPAPVSKKPAEAPSPATTTKAEPAPAPAPPTAETKAPAAPTLTNTINTNRTQQKLGGQDSLAVAASKAEVARPAPVEPSPPPKEDRSAWIWIGVGGGGLLLLAGGAVLVLMGRNSSSASAPAKRPQGKKKTKVPRENGQAANAKRSGPSKKGASRSEEP
jgi:hypothetical protein